jgi:MOSC domain-containing protein YiiM
MQVVSVNVGRARELRGRSFDGVTGIFKESAEAPVTVTALGLKDDAICDGKHHGGPDQAVYLYRQEDYDWWSEALGRPVAPGTFGDNLTVAGLPSPALPIGARLTFPELVLEVTAPRIPCNTLAQRMDDPTFGKAFVRAERPGIYARVVREGRVTAGDAFTLEAADAGATTVDLFRDSYRRLDADRLRHWLALPIDERTRARFEAELAARG